MMCSITMIATPARDTARNPGRRPARHPRLLLPQHRRPAWADAHPPPGRVQFQHLGLRQPNSSVEVSIIRLSYPLRTSSFAQGCGGHVGRYSSGAQKLVFIRVDSWLVEADENQRQLEPHIHCACRCASMGRDSFRSSRDDSAISDL